MKKLLAFVLAVLIVSSSSAVTFADSKYSQGTIDKNVELEERIEIVIENEEDMLNYSLDPNFLYSFVIPELHITRAVCYNCGKPNMGLATYKDNKATLARACPVVMFATYSDHMYTWDNYKAERCTACGYKGNKIVQFTDTYSSECYNTAFGNVFEVRKDWFQKDGHDIHSVYVYWTEGRFV